MEDRPLLEYRDCCVGATCAGKHPGPSQGYISFRGRQACGYIILPKRLRETAVDGELVAEGHMPPRILGDEGHIPTVHRDRFRRLSAPELAEAKERARVVGFERDHFLVFGCRCCCVTGVISFFRRGEMAC